MLLGSARAPRTSAMGSQADRLEIIKATVGMVTVLAVANWFPMATR